MSGFAILLCDSSVNPVHQSSVRRVAGVGAIVAVRDGRSEPENPMKRVSLIAGSVIVVLVIISVIIAQHGRGFATISAEELHRRLGQDSTVVLLDVRRTDEYRGEAGHLQGALLIPLDELERRIGELARYQHRTLIVYCLSGRRSSNASAYLSHHGYSPINLDGGIRRWTELGFPVMHERSR